MTPCYKALLSDPQSPSILSSSGPPKPEKHPSKVLCYKNAVGFFEAPAFWQGQKELQNKM